MVWTEFLTRHWEMIVATDFLTVEVREPSIRERALLKNPDCMALQAGDKLGPYEIVTPIGVGGKGEAYGARDTRLDRLVASKT